MSFTAAERESVLQCDDESGIWVVSTYQSKVITKLRKVNVEPISVSEDGLHKYELDFGQVSFRSGKKRAMSEEQRKKNSDRLKKMHEDKKKNEGADEN